MSRTALPLLASPCLACLATLSLAANFFAAPISAVLRLPCPRSNSPRSFVRRLCRPLPISAVLRRDALDSAKPALPCRSGPGYDWPHKAKLRLPFRAEPYLDSPCIAEERQAETSQSCLA